MQMGHGTKNGVGIVISRYLKKMIVNVSIIGYKILSIKVALRKKIIHIIIAYAPQVGSRRLRGNFGELLN